eukprot:tig00000076_g2317.t1
MGYVYTFALQTASDVGLPIFVSVDRTGTHASLVANASRDAVTVYVDSRSVRNVALQDGQPLPLQLIATDAGGLQTSTQLPFDFSVADHISGIALEPRSLSVTAGEPLLVTATVQFSTEDETLLSALRLLAKPRFRVSSSNRFLFPASGATFAATSEAWPVFTLQLWPDAAQVGEAEVSVTMIVETSAVREVTSSITVHILEGPRIAYIPALRALAGSPYTVSVPVEPAAGRSIDKFLLATSSPSVAESLGLKASCPTTSSDGASALKCTIAFSVPEQAASQSINVDFNVTDSAGAKASRSFILSIVKIRLNITLAIDFSSFTAARETVFARRLAREIEVFEHQVAVADKRPGSVVLDVRVASDPAAAPLEDTLKLINAKLASSGLSLGTEFPIKEASASLGPPAPRPQQRSTGPADLGASGSTGAGVFAGIAVGAAVGGAALVGIAIAAVWFVRTW